MTVQPFSSAHLRILDELPQEPCLRERDAGRFVVIGEPVMVKAGRNSARRRAGWRRSLRDADALVLSKIYIHILEGRYSGLASDEAKQARIFADIDNCVRSEVAREARRRRRLAPIGAHADRLVSGDPDYLALEEELERVQSEVVLLRSLHMSPVDRLLLLLLIHPAHVDRTDVEKAVAGSRVVLRQGRVRYDGLTRSAEETLLLVEQLVCAPIGAAEGRTFRARKAIQRLRLAWTLRGPRGCLSPADWPDSERLRAENWLDHRRSHALGVLAGCEDRVTRDALIAMARARRRA